MRITEIALSAIIAFAVVYVIYQNDMGSSVPLKSSSNNYTVEINSVPTALANTVLTIPVAITGEINERIKFYFRFARPEVRGPQLLHRFGASPLTVVDSASGLYQANMLIGPKGTLSRYYFEIRDPVGRNLAGLKNSDGQALTTLAIGKVDNWVKYGYYLCLFFSAIFVTMGGFGSIRILAGKSGVETIGKTFLAAALFTIAAVFIFGNLNRIQLIGSTWQGAPFGINLADNLKQILVLYLVFLALAVNTVMTKSGQMRTVFPKKSIGYFGVVSFFLMITAFLLPLLVKPEYVHIPAIFYSFLTFLIFGYFLVFRRTKHA